MKLIGLIALASIVYLLGPKVKPPTSDSTLPEVPSDLVALECWITEKEEAIPNIKPD